MILVFAFALLGCGGEAMVGQPGGAGGTDNTGGGGSTAAGGAAGETPQCSWTKGGSGDGCGVTFKCPDGEFIFFCLINPTPHCVCNPGGDRDYATSSQLDYCTDQKTSAAELNPVCGWNVD